MKPNTHVHVAITNVGDAAMAPIFFEGTFKESILWIAMSLTPLNMAGRFQIGIGRNAEGAKIGIGSGRSSASAKAELAGDIGDALESLFADSDAISGEAAAPGMIVEQDVASAGPYKFHDSNNRVPTVGKPKNPEDDYQD